MIASRMEPTLVQDKEFENLIPTIIAEATELKNSIPPNITFAISDLVKSMNCYYSNLIEDHYTKPIDIDRALNAEYSDNIEKRNLQLEAKAHIEVQTLIDNNLDNFNVVSQDFFRWVHEEFYNRLPKEFKIVKDKEAKIKKEITPGKFRDGDVQVVCHIPIKAEELDIYLKRFGEVYAPETLSKYYQIIAIPCSHHRFLWIHPFYDGNGRVVRMFSQSYFNKIGIGSTLWSISRGLARRVDEYKLALMDADSRRKNDFDGRGNLSEKGLKNFCIFFLETTLDQIRFMKELFEPKSLLERIGKYVDDEIEKGSLLKGSFSLLREAYFTGEVNRGKIQDITGYKERQARKVLSELLKQKLLVSGTKRGPVRLNFTNEIAMKMFPKLYL